MLTIKISSLPEFDLAEHLKTNEDVANYLTVVLEENDPAELAHALGVIARARHDRSGKSQWTDARGAVQGLAP